MKRSWRGCVTLPTALVLAVLLPIAAASAETAPVGSYECWFFSSPRMLYNFTLQKSGSYVDSSGNTGSVALAEEKMQFQGGNLDGQTGVYKGGNPPTVSFIDANGEESFFCQLAQ